MDCGVFVLSCRFMRYRYVLGRRGSGAGKRASGKKSSSIRGDDDDDDNDNDNIAAYSSPIIVKCSSTGGSRISSYLN
ncbi:uncharacterized protein RAG0_08516 [Rhynchosporium agropyri]|uniref:Uncharacterized protein n=1 Tax=Rhynchosporium agropyri TaxID=914238 RepID=A0A1E1KR52_9HELO|nr:uncharacterized protein RAG0_08516 [Rhynchosporium agropyri]